MDFASLVAAVITKTGRPDMGLVSAGGDGRIPLQVQASTLSMHISDFFLKDIVTASVAFNSADYVQILDTTALTKFRKLAFFRKSDPAITLTNPVSVFYGSIANQGAQIGDITGQLSNHWGDPLGFLKILSAQEIIDGYGYEKSDVAYQAGTNIFLKSSNPLSAGSFGFFQFPNLGVVGNNYADYSSWIANDYPFCIIYHAVSAIFQDIGKDEASRKYDGPNGLVAQEKQNLLTNNITAEGF
jgi:hypothetical protein